MSTATLEPPAVVWYRHPAPPKRRVPNWLITAALVVLAVALFFAGVGAAGGLVLGFAVLTPIERLFRRHEQRVRRPGLRTDLFHLLLSGFAATACLIVPVVIWTVLLIPVMPFAPATWFASLSLWVQAPIALLVQEFLGYWVHRLQHGVPFLWRFHAVHHSSQQLDWLSGARLHPMEGAVIGAVAGPALLLLGVGPATLGVLGAVTSAWGVLLHMNVRWRMRWLDGIWSSPDFHHWHHSNHDGARNRNFAGFLPILDRLFGTYHLPWDERPTVYGINEPMPDGWWWQVAHPFRRPALAVPAVAEPTSFSVDRGTGSAAASDVSPCSSA